MTDMRTLIFTIVLALAPLAQGKEKFIIGFENNDNMLSNVDSVSLAFKYLFNEFAASQGLAFEFAHFRCGEKAKRAYTSGSVDLYAINTPVFFLIEEEVKKRFAPSLILSESQKPACSLCFVVRKGVSLDDLKGKSINIRTQHSRGIEVIWSELLFLRKYQTRLRDYFKTVTLVQDVSDAVLPVFFGKADACILPEPQYELLIELNPHLKEKLEVYRRSPPLVPLIAFFTDKEKNPEVRKSFVEAATEIHKTAKGEQALTLLQLSRLFDYSDEVLAPTKRLVEKHQTLYQATLEPLAITEDE